MYLHVKIIKAKDLPKMDIGPGAKSDPYVRLSIKGRDGHQKTKVKHNEKKCKWEEEFSFEIFSYSTEILKLQMFDEDPGKDDKMGKLLIAVNQLPPGQVIDQKYALKPTKGCKKPGILRCAFQVVLKGATKWTAAPFVPQQVVFNCIKAKDLAKMDTFGKSDPFAKITLKGTSFSYTTKVKNNTLKAKWDETVTFPLTNPATDVIHVLVKDKDVKSDDDMCYIDIQLVQYANGQEQTVKAPMTPAKGVKKGGQLKYKIKISPAPAIPYAAEQTGVYTKRK
jgi:Ca2+-dependent lipid-binding protein